MGRPRRAPAADIDPLTALTDAEGGYAFGGLNIYRVVERASRLRQLHEQRRNQPCRPVAPPAPPSATGRRHRGRTMRGPKRQRQDQ